MPITAADLLALQDVPPPTQDTSQTSEYELFDYQKAIIRIKKLIGSWSDENDRTKARRRERYVKLDVEDLRKQGKIEIDETFVPDRMIDTNIRREQPEYVAFLKQSRRLAI